MSKSQLEENFKNLQLDVKKHINDAVKSINAANELVKSKTGKSLASCTGNDYDYDDNERPEDFSDDDLEKLEILMEKMDRVVRPLLVSLYESGWNTSSLEC